MKTARELVEAAETLISQCNWTAQTEIWRTAAEEWREDYNDLVAPQKEVLKSLDEVLTLRVTPDVKALIIADLKARL
jgi:hypothetical protein